MWLRRGGRKPSRMPMRAVSRTLSFATLRGRSSDGVTSLSAMSGCNWRWSYTSWNRRRSCALSLSLSLQRMKCLGLASLSRTIARQRSWLMFLRGGDTNTKFFTCMLVTVVVKITSRSSLTVAWSSNQKMRVHQGPRYPRQF
jgi:hypothetical protein